MKRGPSGQAIRPTRWTRKDTDHHLSRMLISFRRRITGTGGAKITPYGWSQRLVSAECVSERVGIVSEATFYLGKAETNAFSAAGAEDPQKKCCAAVEGNSGNYFSEGCTRNCPSLSNQLF